MKTTIKIIVIESPKNPLRLFDHTSCPREIRCVDHLAYGESLAGTLPAAHADVVLLDWELPALHAAGAVRRLKTLMPAVPILLTTSHDDGRMLADAVVAGVDGFLAKPATLADLVLSLADAQAGRCPLRTRHAHPLFVRMKSPVTAALAALSPREREILGHLAGGLAAKEVAAHLRLSLATINTHKQNIMLKLNARNITEAVARCAGFGG